jgi:hypothetical protein
LRSPSEPVRNAFPKLHFAKPASRKNLLKSQNDKITLKMGGFQPNLCPDYAREENGIPLNGDKTAKTSLSDWIATG